ncbi:N-carbamoyl-L-amino-acid hydrolase [Pseudochelatococcus lubricantis]|uniref:N-carbamoyl-L-amino-acid hydrolase n=1 Tax=Pseudochelatococcus lubricantis TaxID=1538102 RepID=A0ABX0V150_9HYPH|nr:Zn-dependent hydrolase [Pseudochelatococcus lubricantis]NIJ58853.1 N-carbamoyl-L-amino-acid hydrolase [Pseudochelatococcus lubricantis]
MTISAETRVDLMRFWSTIERSAQIGVGRPGGLSRLTLGDADRDVRNQFVAWCREAGLGVEIDTMGNIFGRRAGQDDTLPPVMIGSHLDTQINGGRFDGIAGVLAGLEVVRTLNDAGHTTRRPIAIVDWTNEEGARFSPPMVASGCFVGRYETAWCHDLIADDGARFGDELERIGYKGDIPCKAGEIDAYFELHIEQGPILDAEGREVGVVTGGYPSYGMRVRFTGETAHTGPTPMDLRHNALIAGARFLTAVDDIGWEFAILDGKATGSRLAAWPNKPGTLSETAECVADVRHPDPATARVMAEKMRRAASEAAAKAGCALQVEDEWFWGGDIFDPELIGLIRSEAVRQNCNWRDIQSQAGHDAYHLAMHCPSAMIFTPCKNGITHNNKEDCDPESFRAGLNMLLHAVVNRADR